MPLHLCLPAEARVVANQLWRAIGYGVASRCGSFEPDEQLKENVLAAATLLTSQTEPRFGILVNGFTGTGKTVFVCAIQHVVNSYQLCVDPTAEFRQRYELSLLAAKDILKNDVRNPDYLATIQNRPMLAIDDLGEEAKEAVSYGNVLTPIIDLIEHRYSRRLFTIVTTNLSPSEIYDKYGARIASRLSEMMLVLNFTHRDHRVAQHSINNSKASANGK